MLLYHMVWRMYRYIYIYTFFLAKMNITEIMLPDKVNTLFSSN
jgi:hypothetical protein